MDKQMHCADTFEEWNEAEAVRVAETVRQDLRALLAILERELSHASKSDCETRAHLAEAKAAAERGVELSDRLVGMLRTIS